MIIDFSICDATMSITRQIFHLLLIWKIKEAQCVIIRSYKKAFYCDLREPVHELVARSSSAIIKTNKCSFIAFVSVDLIEQYSIQAVVVHVDTSIPETKELDYFTVYLNEGSLSAYCSEWPNELTWQHFVLNCAQWPKLFSEVQINSRGNRGLSIDQIEVGTLSRGLPHVKYVLLYRGCFENFGDKTMDYEWNVCYRKCFRYGFIFAGIKDNNYCACGNNVNAMKELPLNKCYLKCNDSDGFCGGRGSYSVYIIRVPLPYYEGCYESSANYTEKEVLNGSTYINIKECLVACNNHRYAVLQNSYCMCEDEIANIQERKISSFCDVPCHKQDRFDVRYVNYCGGVNYMSVWSTCKQGSEKFITCSELLQCADGALQNHYGWCRVCKSGFVGRFCISQNAEAEYNETDDFNDGISGNDTLDYMNVIGNWIKRDWIYILLALLLTIVGIVMWFNLSSRRHYKRGLPSPSAIPATKRKGGPKVEQKGKKEPRKASTSKKSQTKKSESRKFGKLGKLFRKKQSNVNLLTKTKAKPSVAAESLAKKRKESHISGLHKPAIKQSIVASLYDKPKQELPTT